MDEDRTHWTLPAEVYDSFVELLEAETRELPRLEKLFTKPTPFTKDCE